MNWAIANWASIVDRLVDHLWLTIPALLLSIAIAVPLGRIANGTPRSREALLAATGLLYAIPSLPLLIVIPLLFGMPLRSAATVTIALTVYGVALLARTAADAFAAVPTAVLAAATATGHTRWQVFTRFEVPLAMPILIAGTRVVAMSSVGLATIGALIGVPSLGSLFTDGFQRGIVAEVMAGIVVTVLLAASIDTTLRLIGHITQPWRRTSMAVAA